MNIKALFALATALLTATSLADSVKPDLVVDVIVLEGSTGTDKYAIQNVKVVSIVQNHTSYKIPEQIAVAHHSKENGIPAGNARLFLGTYYKSSPELWLLIQFQVTSKNNALKTPASQAATAETLRVSAAL